MTWRFGYRSVRGRSHYASGQPCQDSSAARVLADGTLVAAVADGGGSAPLSHFGSRIATVMTVNALALAAPLLLGDDDDARAKQRAEDFCRALVGDIRACIEAEAKQVGTSAQQFGTTLLAAAATRERAIMMQIGDGFIVYATAPPSIAASTAAPMTDGPASGSPFTLAFTPARGEFAGEVTWITSSSWDSDFHFRYLPGPFDFLCLSSDGLEKVAIVQLGQVPHRGYFEFMRTQMGVQAQTKAGMDGLLATVLLNPELDTRTDDDKSIVLARWFDAASELSE